METETKVPVAEETPAPRPPPPPDEDDEDDEYSVRFCCGPSTSCSVHGGHETTNHRNLPPDCKLKQERKTRCCTRRSTGIRRPVPSYYEGTAHPIPVLLRVQHLVFLSCFSSQAGENRWSSKFKFQRQLEFKTRPFCSYPHPHHHSTGKSLHVGCIQAQIQILVSNGHLPVWFSARIRLVVSWPPCVWCALPHRSSFGALPSLLCTR